MILPILAAAVGDHIRFESLGLHPDVFSIGFFTLRWYSLAYIAGIVGGFGRGFSANANSLFSGLTAGADGQRSSLSAGDIVQGGLGQGVGDAADSVSKYLIERAEQYQPVIEMPTGIDVEIVFLDGVYVRNSQ